MTDPENRTTSYQYDDLGRRTKLTQPDPDDGGSATAPETIYAYDLVGNLTSVTDPNTHQTTYGYDNLYRQTSMTNANSETTNFSFDSVGNMLSLTDPESNTTEWEYDGLDRMTVETITLDSTDVDRTYAYDAVGNLIEKIDRNGRKTTYSYDNIYQLDQEKWFDLSQTLVNTIDYDYNEIGELDSVTDGSSSSTYDYLYDDLGRTTQSLFTFDSRTAQFDYEYDVASNMTVKSATLDSTLDFENTYGYDDLHRLMSFTQTGQSGGNTVADKHVTLAYNDASQRTELLRYADDYDNAANLVIDTAYDYDDIGRLTQIDHTDGTSTIHKFDFTYDPASRIDSILSSVDGLRDYSYDDTNQLTGVEDASQTSLEDYSYDDNGNRTNTGYTTGDYNRLLSDGTHNYEYDNEGNRTRRVHSTTGATTVYQWDHRNRLTAVIDYANETDADADQYRTQTVEHQYDAFNQWIAKTVDADGDGAGAAVDEFYIHEGGQIAFRLDDSGSTENRYVWDPTAVDQLWADETIGEELRWSLTDHLGSVHDLVDNAGNVDKHVEYDSFGNVTADSAPSVDLLFGYTGRALDDDTGLQNNLHRWYEATTGRWGSEDPIGFTAGDVNLYRYVGSNPTNTTDPTGLKEGWLGTIGTYINTHVYEFRRPDNVLPPRYRNDDEIRGTLERNGLVNSETRDWEARQALVRARQDKVIHDVVSAPFRFKLRTDYGEDSPNIQVCGYDVESGNYDSIDNYPIDGSIAVRVLVPEYNMIATGGDILASPENPLAYSGALLPMRSRSSHWLLRGSEKDAAWRALSTQDKLYYEIGEKTLYDDAFSELSKLSPVERGKALVGQRGWLGALRPEDAGWRLGVGSTLHSGPTPAARVLIRGGGGTAGSVLQTNQNLDCLDGEQQ